MLLLIIPSVWLVLLLGSPLPCSCLENPRDGGAWWAAVFGVVQSQTRLKQFSSSSSIQFSSIQLLSRVRLFATP